MILVYDLGIVVIPLYVMGLILINVAKTEMQCHMALGYSIGMAITLGVVLIGSVL